MLQQFLELCFLMMVIITKSIVYKAAVLGLLHYAVEELDSLKVFHHCCLRTISRAQQIEQHISNEDVQHRMDIPVCYL